MITALTPIILGLSILPSAAFYLNCAKEAYYFISSNDSQSGAKVGIIPIEGVLEDAYPTINLVKGFFEDEEVKAIVLKINSPGGAPGTAQTIFNEINHFKALFPDKYVIAEIENIAASGGYYVAAAAHYIVASPGACIGSIGVIREYINHRGLFERLNLKSDIFKSGQYKATGHGACDISDDERPYIQERLDDVYRQFTRDVRSQRPELSEDTSIWAEGKEFTGEQALALNLIDEVGSPSRVEEIIKEMAHIEQDILWLYPQKPSFVNRLMGAVDGTIATKALVHSVCDAIESRYVQQSH